MSGYANTTRRKVKNFLVWLSKHKDISLDEGAKHTTITCVHNGKKTLSPVRHNYIDKHLVKALVDWLTENEVCTLEECDKHLK